jgi:hypothetical protein
MNDPTQAQPLPATNEKVDHIITRQWERLAEIQQIQLEIMQDMAASCG